MSSGLEETLIDMPRNVTAALAALRDAEHLPHYIDSDYLALYAATKEKELADLEASISAAEYIRYL